MNGTLRLEDDGWLLEDHNGNEVESGGYPIREYSEFIETEANQLDCWEYHKLPYERVDERDQ